MTVYRPPQWYGNDGEKFILSLDELCALAKELTGEDIRPAIVRGLVRSITEEEKKP